ncbi:uncharacterized protein LOC132277642 [Cornus florida]|uniref:uncharacterized protein LOC132277642 n=1 Tax=Cornus florida TaxID=4283 RepID=UPI00289981A6|nr:uncharacterized protein LOC132277642 [Cornus florida]
MEKLDFVLYFKCSFLSPCEWTYNGFLLQFEGVRQGDPFSPFLFLIVMEALSRMLRRAVDVGFLRSFQVGRDALSQLEISHLMFANDTWFQVVSGLKINVGKSVLVLVGEVPDISVLTNTLGYCIGSFPISYMGLPLGTPSRRMGFWDPVVERFERRMAGSKKQYLSTRRRVTLMKSTLSSLPTYFLSLL